MGCHVKAALGELAGAQGASEDGLDCHEYRCLEQEEYRGDLKRKQILRNAFQFNICN